MINLKLPYYISTVTAAEMGALTGFITQIVYNTDDNKLYYWNSAAWAAL